MSRASRIVLVGILIALSLAAVAYWGALRVSARQLATDDLSWLKREFKLSDAEMQRVRGLHEGYLPKCMEMCAKIAAKKAEVDAALEQGQVPEDKMIELAGLRAQCQAQMLRHFQEVSRAMPAEQGKRYLAEMQRLTLGFHQSIESSMSEAPAAAHHHGHGEH